MKRCRNPFNAAQVGESPRMNKFFGVGFFVSREFTKVSHEKSKVWISIRCAKDFCLWISSDVSSMLGYKMPQKGKISCWRYPCPSWHTLPPIIMVQWKMGPQLTFLKMFLGKNWISDQPQIAEKSTKNPLTMKKQKGYHNRIQPQKALTWSNLQVGLEQFFFFNVQQVGAKNEGQYLGILHLWQMQSWQI